MTTLDMQAHVRRGAFTLAAEFSLPLDGVTVLFGPSGAGKSTLLATLAGLVRLSSGRIVLRSRVLDDVAGNVRVPPHERGVGVVFQDARLFPHLSVRQNLAFAEKRAPVSARILTLREAVDRFDIAAILDRPVRNLSGGEKSRVALARALLSAPSLLLLDEPFSALDGVRRRAFIDVLRDMQAAFQLPMIVVTHDIDDAAALADRVVTLMRGEIAACAPIRDAFVQGALLGMLSPRDSGAALANADVASGGARRNGHVWVRADHVLIAAQEPHGLSARNIWEGRIAAMTVDGGGVLIRVETEVGAVLSRVTEAAAADLALAPGKRVWAIVKASSI